MAAQEDNDVARDDGGELLSDDEKDALLAGVEAGVIGASGGGDSAVSVRPFELAPDAYINFGSYPRLQGICQQMAKRLATLWTAMLRTRATVTADETFSAGFSAAIAKTVAPVIALRIGLSPLPHNALLLFDDALLTVLVEAFFGFTTDDDDETGDAAEVTTRPARQQFTPGELRVAELAADRFLETIPPCWEKLVALTPEVLSREFDPALGSGIESAERVIVCRFEVRALGQCGHLRLLLPEKQVESIVDDLEGAANARGGDGDPRWRAAFEHHLHDTEITGDVLVGDVTLPLRKLVALKPGDLLPLKAPEAARLAIGGVTRAAGGFGTTDGGNAFRLDRWLPADRGNR